MTFWKSKHILWSPVKNGVLSVSYPACRWNSSFLDRRIAHYYQPGQGWTLHSSLHFVVQLF